MEVQIEVANLQRGVSLQLVRVLKLVQVLAEGLHGQVLRESVCLVWLTKYCWEEKREEKRV